MPDAVKSSSLPPGWASAKEVTSYTIPSYVHKSCPSPPSWANVALDASTSSRVIKSRSSSSTSTVTRPPSNAECVGCSCFVFSFLLFSAFVCRSMSSKDTTASLRASWCAPSAPATKPAAPAAMAVCGLCGRAQALLGRACGRVVLMRRRDARIMLLACCACYQHSCCFTQPLQHASMAFALAIPLVVERCLRLSRCTIAARTTR
mmetsp:Transcript_118/g.429  ORF Transcript_118/g.429 Transcript_118/m.429 type:complete len:205 (-) Transcript_118:13-627(-)